MEAVPSWRPSRAGAGMKLEAKGKSRSHKKIARRLPAGSASGDLASVPKGKDYVGAKKSGGMEEYCAAVRGATKTFKESRGAQPHTGPSPPRQNTICTLHATHQLLGRAQRVWHIRLYVVPREGADDKSPAVRAARDAKTHGRAMAHGHMGRAPHTSQARFVSHSYIHVTFGSKRSDGSEVRALEGCANAADQRPCRRPLRPERAALALWHMGDACARQLDGGVEGRRPPYRRR